MQGFRLNLYFAMWPFMVCVSLILLLSLRPGYACCGPPTIDDSCFATAMQTAGLSTAGLSWRPPQSCSAVDEYEVLYTQCACNASDSTKTRMRIQHVGRVILTSLETYNYCISVRAVINETCNSSYSTCVQVGSMEEDQPYNVTMHDDLRIPATLCHDGQHPSKVIRITTQELLHLTWKTFNESSGMNVTYDNTTDTNYFHFHNVTDSFLLLEYCEERRVPCESDSFCSNWVEFVTRRCVTVNGHGGCSDSLQKPFVAPSRVFSASAPSFVSSTSMIAYTATDVSLYITNATDINSTSGVDNSAVIIGPTIAGIIIIITILAILIVIIVVKRRHRKHPSTREFYPEYNNNMELRTPQDKHIATK